LLVEICFRSPEWSRIPWILCYSHIVCLTSGVNLCLYNWKKKEVWRNKHGTLCTKIKQNRDNMDFKEKKIDNNNIRESIHRKIFNNNNKNTQFSKSEKSI